MHRSRAIQPFSYHQPESIESIIELLQEHGPEAALLAGGTALLIDMMHGEMAPSHVISLWGAPGLDELSLNGEMRIGTLASASALADATRDRADLAGLREASLWLGGRQIQNTATVGGNICKASPGADLVPPLLCLDAVLEIVGPEGDRVTPLDGFLTGPDLTDLKPAELLSTIQLPKPPAHTGTAFEKVMRRYAVDCSIVSVAVRVTFEGGTCREARVAVAAAAPNPFRANSAEAVLEGEVIGVEIARAAGRKAREESSPIDDVRASADYRRLLVEELTARAVLTAAERAKHA